MAARSVTARALLAFLGEGERAKEWIERGTLVDPNNTILHFNFVCALSHAGDIDAAVGLLATSSTKRRAGG